MDALREPQNAALFAAAATAGYIYVKTKINNEPVPPNSAFVKPALLIAILVYFIVSQGIGAKETISTEPF